MVGVLATTLVTINHQQAHGMTLGSPQVHARVHTHYQGPFAASSIGNLHVLPQSTQSPQYRTVPSFPMNLNGILSGINHQRRKRVGHNPSQSNQNHQPQYQKAKGPKTIYFHKLFFFEHIQIRTSPVINENLLI